MDERQVVKQLKEEFSGKKIVRLPDENPTEIVCEIEPTEDHIDHSVAIAIIDRSEPHYHKKSVETYHIEKGRLTLHYGDEMKVLEEGDRFVVEPPVVHWAEGNAARVRVESRPGWTVEDHILT